MNLVYGVKIPRLKIDLCWDSLNILLHEIEEEQGLTDNLEYALAYLEDHTFYHSTKDVIFGIPIPIFPNSFHIHSKETEEFKKFLQTHFNYTEENIAFYPVYKSVEGDIDK